jgi:DNA repair exonuclease SbcCD ATPase subunit
LTTQLVTSQKALSKEKSTRSVVDQSLAEEKTARHVAEQALKSSNDAKAELAQELETTQASLTATCDKLIAKSTALDTQVIRDQ